MEYAEHTLIGRMFSRLYGSPVAGGSAAFSDLGGGTIDWPILPKLQGIGGFLIPQAMTALNTATHKRAMIGLLQTKNRATGKIISSAGGKISFNISSLTFADPTTVLRVGLQAWDTVGGPPCQPSGTWLTYVDLTSSSGLTTGWNTVSLTTGSTTVDHGSKLAVVFDLTARGGADTFTFNAVSGSFTGMPTVLNYTGAAWATTNNLPNCAILTDDGTLATIDKGFAITTGGEVTFNDASAADEQGQVFQVPFDCYASGIWFIGYPVSAASDFTAKLYSDPHGTPVELASIPMLAENLGPASTQRQSYIPFAADILLTANTNYVVSLKATGAANIGIVRMLLGNSDYRYFAPGLSPGGFTLRNNLTGAFPRALLSTTLAIGVRIARLGQSPVLAAESPTLVKTLNFLSAPSLLQDSITLTHVRASVATLRDHEGVMKIAVANEAMFEGFRRVENLVVSSDAPTTQGITTVAGAYVISFTGSGSVTYSGTASGTLSGIGATTRVSTASVVTTAGTLTLTLTGDVRLLQVEDVLDQTITAPSEYVSRGTLASPFHGAGVDGVKYFTTANGNTRDGGTGEVTQATGSAYSETTLKGLASWSATTNLVASSSGLSSWTAIGTPTISDSSASRGALKLSLLGHDAGAAAAEGVKTGVSFSGLLTGEKSISLYVKAGTSTSTAVRLRDTTAAANRLLGIIAWSGGVPTPSVVTGTLEGGTAAQAVESVGNGIYRVSFRTTTLAAVANNHELEVYAQSDSALNAAGNGNLLVGGIQCEVGGSCSALIITSGGAASRPITAISTTSVAWFSEAVGADFAEVIFASGVPIAAESGQTPNNSQHYIWSTENNVNNRHLYTRFDGAQGLQRLIRNASVEQLGGNLGLPTRNAITKASTGYLANDMAAAMNNNNAVQDLVGTMPAGMATLYLGYSGSTDSLCGYLRKFRWYSTRPSNDWVKDQTK